MLRCNSAKVRIFSENKHAEDLAMKTSKIIILLNLLAVVLLATGCRRNPNTVWDDTKSAGRHMNRGVRTLGGKHGDSRQVNNPADFYANAEGTYSGEFVPLNDDPNANEIAMGDMVSPPPRETPGDPGSSIPGISAFRDPSTNPAWAGVFRNVYFPYNSSLVKGPENLGTIKDVANYMKANPNLYVFLEGHCDERGPEAYNLSLGSHRSNAVRNMLISEGVNPDNVFTISYGKERPLVYGQGEESWQQNRRAEFKIYTR